MSPDFLLLCKSLNAAVIEPMLREENRDDTMRDFGSLGLDIIQRWNADLKSQA